MGKNKAEEMLAKEKAKKTGEEIRAFAKDCLTDLEPDALEKVLMQMNVPAAGNTNADTVDTSANHSPLKASPSISIIIPAFNAEATVTDLVEDCLAQTYGNVEVICVNDGSDDDTGSRFEGLARCHENVRALSIKHGGPTAARAAGTDAARGEWVIFADADDRVDSDWINSLVVRGSEVDPHGEADIIAGASCWDRDPVEPATAAYIRSAYSGLFLHGQQMDEIWDRLLAIPGNIDTSLSHSMCDKLFRTTLARRVFPKIDKTIRIAEDTCFNVIAFAQARAVALTYTRGYRWMDTQDSLSNYPFASALQDNRLIYALAKRELIACGYGGCAVQLWHEWMNYLVNHQLRQLCTGNESISKPLAAQFMASYEEAAAQKV